MKRTEWGVILTIEDIRKKLAKMYDKIPNGFSFNRDLLIHKSYCNYGRVGAVFFALNGSPPKGYAIYVPDHGYVLFVGAREGYRKQRGVLKIEGLDELPDVTVYKKLQQERKHHEWVPFEDNIIRVMHKGGEKAKDIAKKFGADVTEKKVVERIYWLKKKERFDKPIYMCKDCPEAEKESGHTVFCKVEGVRKGEDEPMCKDMFEVMSK